MSVIESIKGHRETKCFHVQLFDAQGEYLMTCMMFGTGKGLPKLLAAQQYQNYILI